MLLFWRNLCCVTRLFDHFIMEWFPQLMQRKRCFFVGPFCAGDRFVQVTDLCKLPIYASNRLCGWPFWAGDRFVQVTVLFKWPVYASGRYSVTYAIPRQCLSAEENNDMILIKKVFNSGFVVIVLEL